MCQGGRRRRPLPHEYGRVVIAACLRCHRTPQPGAPASQK